MASTHVVHLVVIVLIAVSVCCVNAFNASDVNSIHTALFPSYNNLVRPSEMVEVKVEFVILTINSLEMKTQTLSTSGWFTVTWTDPRLTWTSASYGNVDTVYTNEAHIWRPELVVDNAVTQIAVISDSALLFRVKNDGTIKWDPPGVYSTHCDVDITWFPFDRQVCRIEMTSWTYIKDSVYLTHLKNKLNTEDYQVNGEWDLVSTDIGVSELTEDGEIYSQLEFIITVDRKQEYYLLNVIFPVILTSVLTTVVFLLPVESGERMSFIVTVLLALAVLLTLIADKMPTTSVHTSVLGIYIIITLGYSTLAAIITALILRLHFKEDQANVPPLLERFTSSILLKILCKKDRTNQNIEYSSEDQMMIKKSKANSVGPQVVHVKEESKSIDIEIKLKCRDIGELLDQMFFKAFSGLTLGTTVIFMFALAFGAK